MVADDLDHRLHRVGRGHRLQRLVAVDDEQHSLCTPSVAQLAGEREGRNLLA
jgi:hypothetical protein